MSDICSTCGAWPITRRHICWPKFTVWSPELGQTEADGRTVYAQFPAYAVEKWALLEDSRGEYSIVGGNEARVLVRAVGAEPVAYVVTGRAEPVYSARMAT